MYSGDSPEKHRSICHSFEMLKISHVYVYLTSDLLHLCEERLFREKDGFGCVTT